MKKRWIIGAVLAILVVVVVVLCVLAAPVAKLFVAYPMEMYSKAIRMQFYLKIVDQNGNPVQRYNSYVDCITPRWNPFGESTYAGYWVTSDAEGLAYFDSGRKVLQAYVTAKTAEGQRNEHHLASQRTEIIRCSELVSGGDIVLTTGGTLRANDREHPLVVHIWAHGPIQKLDGAKLKQNQEGDWDEDEWVCLDLLEKKRWMAKSPEGDIAIKRREGPGDYDRAFEVVARKGSGITPAQDSYWVEAPAEGYRNPMEWKKDWDKVAMQAGSSTGVTFFIYFHLKRADSEVYGVMAVDGSDDGYFCYKLNLNGSRNLYSRKEYANWYQ